MSVKSFSVLMKQRLGVAAARERALTALWDCRGEFRWLEDRWMPDAV